MLNNPDFYPTPDVTIRKMLEPYAAGDLKKMQVLEPSAGSGTMLDYLTKFRDVPKKQVYAIESDPELVFTLQGKEYKVVHRNFLDYSGDYLFDLILMNPPFANGDEHLLKAWEIMQTGDVVCLLNAETIRNPHTARRKLLRSIVEDFGSVEYLGNCFQSAVRKTDVEVALVRLRKEQVRSAFDFNFDAVDRENRPDFNTVNVADGLAVNDLTATKLRQYEEVKNAYVAYIRARHALTFYDKGLTSGPGFDVSKLAAESYDANNLNLSYNQFVSGYNAAAWNNILSQLQFDKFLTNGVMDDFNRMRQAQGAMDLTRANIRAFIEMLLLNRAQIMTNAIVHVFDKFTQYHKDNRCHLEGWKTNSSWKVNRKVILPGYLEYDNRWCKNYRVNYDKWREFEDIDKVMCWLTGKNYDDFTVPVREYAYNVHNTEKEYRMKRLREAIELTRCGDNSWQDSEFFEVRSYLKATIHIRFKSEKLWQDFNLKACQGKNWLPQ